MEEREDEMEESASGGEDGVDEEHVVVVRSGSVQCRPISRGSATLLLTVVWLEVDALSGYHTSIFWTAWPRRVLARTVSIVLELEFVYYTYHGEIIRSKAHWEERHIFAAH